MTEYRSNGAWTRAFAAPLALMAALALSACGGGSGAPNNPYAPGPVVPAALQVLPANSTAYVGVPATLTVTGGVPPYRAFSSNPSILPVSQAVAVDTILLLANAVVGDTTVNITVQDAVGTPIIAVVVVKAAPLLPNLITIKPNTDCPAGNLCAGGTGTATVVVTGPGGAGIPARQVRFDVVTGDFAIQSSDPAQPLVRTLTVASDQFGNAIVGLAIPVGAVTQIGVIRATDVTTGNQVTGQFTIQQITSGAAILSMIPSGNTTITGPLKDVCSAGVRVTFYIFGGTPPYDVRVPFPDAVFISGVPVLTNGGSFTVTTNGSCFDAMPFAVTDATGRTIPAGSSPTLTNAVGTVVPPTAPTPPAPADLGVAPSTINVLGLSCNGVTVQFVVTGGTQPYNGSIVINPQTSPVTTPVITKSANGTVFTISFPAGPPPILGGAQAIFTVTDVSSPQKSASATITCP
jgi:hypothetical protein